MTNLEWTRGRAAVLLLSVAAAAAQAGCGVTANPVPVVPGDGGGSCTADKDCPFLTPRCDKNSNTCVPCLPANDNCPLGKRCAFTNGSYSCSGACTGSNECPKSDAGAPGACCGGACLDTSRDPANCGACGKACPALANATSVCNSGACELGACNAGFADCDKTGANGCEVNLKSDAMNCGTCGKTCSAGANQSAACTDGTCTTSCAMGFAHCSNNPGDGCEVNTNTDVANCGGCGKACGGAMNGTASCVSGACAVGSCNPGLADCNMKFADGCEATLATDVMNCGACGKACPALPNAVAGCSGGACGIASCNAGFADCDGLPANGCETAISADVKNCGACGLTCAGANSNQACMAGVCTITSCTPGFADCDGQPNTGCEVNTGVDAGNCGGCGKTCPAPPNALASCANAQCGLGGCKPGFADCNGLPNDGCEADLAAITSCGKCGAVCAAPANATPGCKAGVCGVGLCNAGFADCDGLVGNGCEKSINTDAVNCGKCGNICGFGNAVPQCLGGVCGFSACNAGFADCDKVQGNGCEVNTNTDAKNCGACGFVCGVNTPLCSAGKCVANLYAPVGPQTNIPIANLVGWSQCYLDTYANTGTSLAQIQATCSKAKLMLACRVTGSQTLTLLGWAPRADVIFNTGDGNNTPHNANGIGWYYSTGASWGFALQGDVINRNTCDVKASSIDATGGNGNLRLCYHTSASNINGGWRCGATDTLNSSAAWERVIYQAD